MENVLREAGDGYAVEEGRDIVRDVVGDPDEDGTEFMKGRGKGSSEEVGKSGDGIGFVGRTSAGVGVHGRK